MESKNIFYYTVALVVLICTSQALTGTTQIDAETEGQVRQGRFYGTGIAGSQASAIASSGATGFGGYPFGGLGIAGSSAHASAQSGAMGFGK